MMNRVKNRLTQNQADYILAICRRPSGWQPKSIEDAPADPVVLEIAYVASFEEAHDDMLRCNQYSLRQSLDRWAVIIHPGSQI